MKRTLSLLLSFLPCLIIHGQEPAPRSREWCEWAFWQIPDHKGFSQVDSTGDVTVTIDHPDYMNWDHTRVSRHVISIVYENGAWRINDWDSSK